jgi:Disulphide bond corrector protein DsbC
MKSKTPHKTVTATLLIISAFVFVLAGCKRGSGTGGSPSSPASPAEVSSSAEVVKVEAVPVQINEGGSADATVKLNISAGYHVNANPATFPYLISTEVAPAPDPDGFCATPGKPIYPAAAKAKFDFAEEPLAVYEGTIEVKLPLRLPKSAEKGCYVYPAKGTRNSLPIKVTIQACDHEKCFPPATVDAAIPVEVK